jgi:hypothetical protein
MLEEWVVKSKVSGYRSTVETCLDPSFHYSTIPVFRISFIIPLFHYSNIPKANLDMKADMLTEATRL